MKTINLNGLNRIIKKHNENYYVGIYILGIYRKKENECVEIINIANIKNQRDLINRVTYSLG